MAVYEIIKAKLEAEFLPGKIEIEDESYKHKGHAGYGASGESHFGLVVVSDKFSGKNRLERQRMVYKVLSDELAGPVHAITYLQTQTLAEAEL